MGIIETIGSSIGAFLGSLFSIFAVHWVGPLIATGIVVAGLGFFAWGVWDFLRVESALKARAAALRSAFGEAKSADDRRLAFSAAFGDINTAFQKASGGKRCAALVHDWQEFNETLLKPDRPDQPIGNVDRPSAFLNAPRYAPTWVSTWANIFVGVGLLFTFVGIVAALAQATKTMGADISQSQAALQGLLTVASAKFYTSIAGLGISIALRLLDAWIHGRIRGHVSKLCESLEQGLVHASSTEIAQGMLRELKEQTGQLKKFNTDLAVSIGEKVGAQFQVAISPVTSALHGLHNAIQEQTTATADAIRQGLGAELSKVTGDHHQQVASQIEQLAQHMGELQASVGEQSEAAARAMAEAATAFRNASSGSTQAIEGLASGLESAGASVADTLKHVMEQQAAEFTAGVSNLSAGFTAAGAGFKDELASALSDVAAHSHDAMVRAADDATAKITTAVSAQVASLERTVERTDRISKGLLEAFAAVEAQSRALRESSATTRTALDALRAVATSSERASIPLAEAAGRIGDSNASLLAAVSQQADQALKAREASLALAQQITQSQQVLSEAWRQYSGQFEGADARLGEILTMMSGHLTDTVSVMRQQAQEFDKSFADAIGKLAAKVEGLNELPEFADAISKYAGALEKSAA